MHKDLIIKKEDLSKQADNTWGYLHSILEVYNKLWKAEPDKILDHLTNDQTTLFMYGQMCDQIKEGGFILLISKGYGPYTIGPTPLVGAIKSWGAEEAAKTLKEVSDLYQKTHFALRGESPIEILANLYRDYPEFSVYDDKFRANDGSIEIKAYIEKHLDEFITVID